MRAGTLAFPCSALLATAAAAQNYEIVSRFGLLAPAGTPAPIVTRLIGKAAGIKAE
jgi:hypothetical protein